MRPPEIDTTMFMAGAEKMFAVFPIEACRDVACPGSGYPATERFAPTLASLRIALESAARPYRLQRERQTRQKALEEARAREQPAEETQPRPTYEELQRRCAEAGLIIGARRRRPAFDAEAESKRVRAAYGISQAAWDAIPKAGV